MVFQKIIIKSTNPKNNMFFKFNDNLNLLKNKKACILCEYVIQ